MSPHSLKMRKNLHAHTYLLFYFVLTGLRNGLLDIIIVFFRNWCIRVGIYIIWFSKFSYKCQIQNTKKFFDTEVTVLRRKVGKKYFTVGCMFSCLAPQYHLFHWKPRSEQYGTSVGNNPTFENKKERSKIKKMPIKRVGNFVCQGWMILLTNGIIFFLVPPCWSIKWEATFLIQLAKRLMNKIIIIIDDGVCITIMKRKSWSKMNDYCDGT